MAIGTIFSIALVVLFNVANLQHLIEHVSGGWLAFFLLCFFNGIVFSGVQFALIVLGMAISQARRRPATKTTSCDGTAATVGASEFPRTCNYRWAPGKRTTIRTEPAPSELLKATGICPRHGKGRTRHRHACRAAVPFRSKGGPHTSGKFARCLRILFTFCSLSSQHARRSSSDETRTAFGARRLPSPVQPRFRDGRGIDPDWRVARRCHGAWPERRESG